MNKKLIFLLLLPVFTQANTYYVSYTTGADSNPGTILQPFKNWDRLTAVMHSGDVAYIKGGTYLTPFTAGKEIHCYWNNLPNVTISAYPGEFPVFDLSNIGNPTQPDPYCVYIDNSPGIKVYGLRVTGLKQNTSGTGISHGIGIRGSANALIEFCTADHIGGPGIQLFENSNDVTIKNCDMFACADNLSNPSPYGGADGFDRTQGYVNSTRTRLIGCRFYDNGDDGIDMYDTDGITTYDSCWVFHNGFIPGTNTPAGNGAGFKLGPTHTDQTSTTLRFLNNCLAFDNDADAYDQNGTPTTLYRLYNCNAYRNHGWGFQFQYYPVSPLAQTFKNNISYLNTAGDLKYTGSNTNNTNNTWSGGVTVSAADFVSLDTTGVRGPRGPNGELPVLNFMKLVSGSDLRGAGVNVGYGTDIGAYQYSGVILPTANAGADQIITLPVTTATLSGSGTGTSITYQWTALDGGALSASTSATCPVTGLVTAKIYRFVLAVTDGSSNVARDTTQIKVDSVQTVLPTGVIMQSVVVNRLGKAVVPFTATVTANSLSFNVQRRFPRGTSFSTIGSITAVPGKTQYKASYSIPAGYVVRVCPVDKQGNPVCSASVVVKKN